MAAAADAVDRSFHAALARFTGGVSPAAVALAFADWQLHLWASPGKRAALAGRALQAGFQLADASVPRHPVLRSNDLIWSRIVHDYLIGERAPPSDLMSWNAD